LDFAEKESGKTKGTRDVRGGEYRLGKGRVSWGISGRVGMKKGIIQVGRLREVYYSSEKTWNGSNPERSKFHRKYGDALTKKGGEEEPGFGNNRS